MVVHIHDIPFRYLTPDPARWVYRKHRFWNEAFLSHPFLAFNDAFEMIVSSSFLHHKASDMLQGFRL